MTRSGRPTTWARSVLSWSCFCLSEDSHRVHTNQLVYTIPPFLTRPTLPHRPLARVGQPWTETEHAAFVEGLKKLGKGNWRGISRVFVTTRTPTQVASHAQVRRVLLE